LTEEEAVLIALCNNALFQELLADLDVAYGDLVQAGLLPNPEVVYYFPGHDKPFKYLLDFPIEALWLRPMRVAAAESEAERACQRLTQAGLDLIRDTRQAYADVLVARGRLGVAEEAVALRQRIAKFAGSRFEAGEASPQEVSVANTDVELAHQDVARLRYDVNVLEERLRNLLGMGSNPEKLELTPSAAPLTDGLDAEALVQDALGSRPDMAAAEEFVAAADARVALAETSWFRLLGILDATSGTRTGHAFSPAFRVTLPIFNRNEGAIIRADAELQRAIRQQQTLHDRIIMEVRQAHLRYQQTRAELRVLDEKVLPEVETGIKRAEAAYSEGDAPYIVVLQATRQLLDSKARREQLHGDLRRNWAELERSVGRHIEPANAPFMDGRAPGATQHEVVRTDHRHRSAGDRGSDGGLGLVAGDASRQSSREAEDARAGQRDAERSADQRHHAAARSARAAEAGNGQP
jgi:cobalt-zinc-cadmium efflux system outer membrane protein